MLQGALLVLGRQPLPGCPTTTWEPITKGAPHHHWGASPLLVDPPPLGALPVLGRQPLQGRFTTTGVPITIKAPYHYGAPTTSRTHHYWGALTLLGRQPLPGGANHYHHWGANANHYHGTLTIPERQPLLGRPAWRRFKFRPVWQSFFLHS